MAEEFTTQRLLVLRKLTRAMADLLRGHAKEYLATFAPIFRPRSILGGYTETNPKETVPGAERAFKELQALYESVAGSKVFDSIGIGAMLAPNLLKRVGSGLRPVVKGVVRAGYSFVEKTKETVAEASEQYQDIVAEVRSEQPPAGQHSPGM